MDWRLVFLHFYCLASRCSDLRSLLAELKVALTNQASSCQMFWFLQVWHYWWRWRRHGKQLLIKAGWFYSCLLSILEVKDLLAAIIGWATELKVKMSCCEEPMETSEIRWWAEKDQHDEVMSNISQWVNRLNHWVMIQSMTHHTVHSTLTHTYR